MMRHFPFEKNLEIIKLAKKYLGNGCCAIDLAGSEAQFKTSSFEELFKIAKTEGIPFTIHAGEADGVESLISAINFGTKRIGHGVRCIEDENVVNMILDKGIYLEVCPTSNIDTKTFNSMKEHSIKKLVDNNILVTISTDNRTVSNTNLDNEYKILSDTFGFNNDDFLKFNLNAIDAAFISEEEKEDLRRRLFE
jgi:adenosine deaminase